MSNKLYSEESIQAIANSIRAKNGTSETYTVSEMSTAISALPTNLTTKTITANGTYNASSDDADGYSSVTVAVEGYAKKSIVNTPTAIATFNAAALPMPSLKVGIEAVQSGTGDPSPTNIRPFSGWSAVNVYDTGKNLFNENFSNYSESSAYLYYDRLPKNQALNISFEDKDTTIDVSGINIGFSYNYTTGPLTNYRWSLNNGVIASNLTNITNRGNYGNTIIIYPNDETTFNKLMARYNIKITIGSDVESYETYNGITYTTTLKDSQGNPLTCYGGELSNENGVQTLTDEVACDDIGSVSVTYRTDTTKPIFQLVLSKHADETIYSTATNAISSCYKLTTSQNVSQEGYNGCFAISADGTRGYIQDLDYTDATLFKTARTGQKICYKLATPQQISQDNLAIATQDGTNNLWADSGDVLSGEYLEAL